MLQDLKRKDFGDNGSKKQINMNKAVLYVNAFEQMLQDFKNKDFGDNGGEKQIAVNKTVKKHRHFQDLHFPTQSEGEQYKNEAQRMPPPEVMEKAKNQEGHELAKLEKDKKRGHLQDLHFSTQQSHQA